MKSVGKQAEGTDKNSARRALIPAKLTDGFNR